MQIRPGRLTILIIVLSAANGLLMKLLVPQASFLDIIGILWAVWWSVVLARHMLAATPAQAGQVRRGLLAGGLLGLALALLIPGYAAPHVAVFTALHGGAAGRLSRATLVRKLRHGLIAALVGAGLGLTLVLLDPPQPQLVLRAVLLSVAAVSLPVLVISIGLSLHDLEKQPPERPGSGPDTALSSHE